MKILAALLLFAPLLSAQAAPTVGTATTATINWTPSPVTPGVTITQYTAVITSPAGNTVVIPACSTTVTKNCIAPGQSTSSFVYAPGGGLYYGTWTVVITTNATNSVGTILTAAATGTATYALAVPPVTTVPAVGGVTIQFTVPAPVAN